MSGRRLLQACLAGALLMAGCLEPRGTREDRALADETMETRNQASKDRKVEKREPHGDNNMAPGAG